MDNPKKRSRRSKKSIEEDLFNATNLLVCSKGFENITLREIMTEAGVESGVMYKRFKNIDDLFDKFIRQYDYWFHDLLEFNTDTDHPIKSLKDVLVGLADALYNNVTMQKILVWELSQNNKLTKRTAMSRELHSMELLGFFRENMKSSVNFDCFASLMIGGIYYLTLHKDISTFCEIDFDKKDGKQLLLKTVEQVIEIIFNQKDITKEKEQIAMSLLNHGIDINIISQSTGISNDRIENLKIKSDV